MRIMEDYRLYSLSLRNPKYCIETTHLRQLGERCTSLESLTLADYNRDSLPSPLVLSRHDTFFPSLTCLVLEGDKSSILIGCLNRIFLSMEANQPYAIKNKRLARKIHQVVRGFGFDEPGSLRHKTAGKLA